MDRQGDMAGRTEGTDQGSRHYHLARRRKFMDKDNATATMKPYLDGLVECGIIEGDTPDIVTDITIWQFLYGVDHPIEGGEIDCIIEEVQT
jgi:hypothetical protein